MTIDLHDAISQAAEGARQLGTIAQSARRRIVELEMELEEVRRELGRLRAGAEPEADPVTYLLWSGKHQAWWKPDARGYTPTEREAGRYTRAEALQHVVASAQCGIRDQVTSMVAAPDNWVGLSPTPVVLAVDPGVQVEQEPPAVESARPWRVVVTDTESMTGIAPVCETDHAPHSEDGDPLADWVFDCCPGPHIELWSEDRAKAMAALFTEVEAMAAGS